MAKFSHFIAFGDHIRVTYPYGMSKKHKREDATEAHPLFLSFLISTAKTLFTINPSNL